MTSEIEEKKNNSCYRILVSLVAAPSASIDKLPVMKPDFLGSEKLLIGDLIAWFSRNFIDQL
jgi:hypothetical protein